MKYIIKYILTFAFTLGIAVNVYAQIDTILTYSKNISLIPYLNLVGKQNLGLLAQQYNVSIAEAGIESAKIFPDPQLSVGAYNNQESKLHLGQGVNFSLGTTLELGGKRSARINLAKSQTELSKALLTDYLRNLRADAAMAYYNAIQQKDLLVVQENSYQAMKHLADADSIRFKLGAIAQMDARQSKLEASSFLNSVIQNESDWKSSLLQLSIFTGNKNMDTVFVPVKNSDNLERTFVLAQLINNAQNNRADAVAAQNSKTVAEKNLSLVKANRIIDLGINTGMQFSGASTNEIAPTPTYHSVNAGLSVPLKFSNHYKGDLKAAHFTIQQAAVQYDQVLQQIQADVTQSYFNYKSAQKQVQQYKSGLIAEAEKVLNGKIYSYKRGETSLLEVLNAQRTYNDLQESYYQSLYNYAAALITLERSAGIWDLQ